MSDELELSAQEFGAFLSLVMVSDPWPIAQIDEGRVKDVLNREADRRGYSGWVDAYHELCGGDE